VMVPNNYVKFIDTMKSLISTGAVPMSRINDAVTRILRVKLQAGLFEYPYADNFLKANLGALVSSTQRLSFHLYRRFKHVYKCGSSERDPGMECT
jgi:beta-glucosidase-like glycosyl hydrolase